MSIVFGNAGNLRISPTARAGLVESISVDAISSRSGSFAVSLAMISTSVTTCGGQGEHRRGQHTESSIALVRKEYHTGWLSHVDAIMDTCALLSDDQVAE